MNYTNLRVIVLLFVFAFLFSCEEKVVDPIRSSAEYTYEFRVNDVVDTETKILNPNIADLASQKVVYSVWEKVGGVEVKAVGGVTIKLSATNPALVSEYNDDLGTLTISISDKTKSSAGFVDKTLTITARRHNTILTPLTLKVLAKDIIPETAVTLARKTTESTTQAFTGVELDLTKLFDVTVTPETASIKSVTWSIDPPNVTVATISDAGKLTPKLAGTVQIKVTTTNASIASTTSSLVIITTVNVTSIMLTRKSAQTTTKAVVGTNLDLKDIFDVVINPSTATNNNTVTWSTDTNVEVATLTSKGMLTPKKSGRIVVKITLVSNKTTLSDKTYVAYSDIDIPSIELVRKDKNASLTAGTASTKDLTEVFLIRAYPLSLASAVNWSIDPAYTGASLTNAGVLSITAAAVAGSVKVKVTSTSNSDIFSPTYEFDIKPASGN